MTRRLRGFWLAILMAALALLVLLVLFASGTLFQLRGSNPTISFDTTTPPATYDRKEPGSREARFERSLSQLNEPYGLWLSGFPSYASFNVPLPIDAKVTNARLILKGEQSVSDLSNAMLRLSLNGRRVNEYSLRAGASGLLIDLPLDPRFLEDNQLRVSLMLDGDVPAGMCNDDKSLGAAVRLLPDSGLYGDLRNPLATVRDVMALMPSDVVIAAPLVPGQESWFELAARIGARFIQNGYDVEFANLSDIPEDALSDRGVILVAPLGALRDAGFSPPVSDGGIDPISVWTKNQSMAIAVTETDSSAALRFLSSSLVPIADGPTVAPIIMPSEAVTGSRLGLEDLGADLGVLRISGRRSWRIPFGLRDMPQGLLPGQLTVRLATSDADEDTMFVIELELNGQLIGTQKVEPGTTGQTTFEIPASSVHVANDLTLSVRRDEHEGGCLISRERIPVQLLSGSDIEVAGRPGYVRGFPDMPGVFSQGVDVILPPGVMEGRAVWALDTVARLLSDFLAYDLKPNFVWRTFNDPGRMPLRPFIAIDHLPPSTSVPVVLADGRLRVQGPRGTLVDVGSLNNLSLVEIGRTVPPKPKTDDPRALAQVPPSVPGLVALRIGEAPMLGEIDYGWQTALVVPKPNQAIEIQPSGRLTRNRTMHSLTEESSETEN